MRLVGGRQGALSFADTIVSSEILHSAPQLPKTQVGKKQKMGEVHVN